MRDELFQPLSQRKNGYNLSREQSGHLVFLEHATTGDGIIAAPRMLAIMVHEHRPLPEQLPRLAPVAGT